MIPMSERVFNRIPSFDERSRAFNVRAILDRTQPRSYTWGCGVNLDQGREGACVGFAWSQEAAAKPKVIPVSNATARQLYHDAQKVDEWPGENYEGTSVLAGAKTVQRYGWVTEYRWAFNLTDALTAISRTGPVVLGVNWYDAMFDTDRDGLVHVAGSVAGGHAILARGVNVKARTVLLHNSWGTDWGGTRWGPGTALITWDDLERLLSEDGEVCVPVTRQPFSNPTI